MNDEVRRFLYELDKDVDEKFESDSFGPSDVVLSMQGLPIRVESPGSPPTIDEDCDTNPRASI